MGSLGAVYQPVPTEDTDVSHVASPSLRDFKKAPNEEKEGKEKCEDLSLWELFKNLRRVLRRFFVKENKLGLFYLGLLFVLSGACTWMSYEFMIMHRDFSTALSKWDDHGFHVAIHRFIVLLTCALPLFATYRYIQELLAITWRKFLTELLLSNYFCDRAYYDMRLEGKLDNPDERMCEDARTFVLHIVEIIDVLSGKVFNTPLFTYVLWSISPWLVYFLVLYAGAGSVITILYFFRRLTCLKVKANKCEGNFRFAMVRVRIYAESIAFYAGEEHEKGSLKEVLRKLVTNVEETLRWNFKLSLFRHLYDYCTVFVPTFIIAPRYFRKEVDFGVIPQTTFAFQMVMSALSVIVLKLGNLSGLAAETQRLSSLLDTFEDHKNKSRPGRHDSNIDPDIDVESNPQSELSDIINRGEGNALKLIDLSVATPGSASLTFKFPPTLELQPGNQLLIMGPTGCGKSSLLRAIAGLWNHGKGHIQAPPRDESLFLPQKPYILSENLIEQLCFPSTKYSPQRRGYGEVENLRKHLSTILEEVSLAHLPNLFRWDYTSWPQVLSPGQQQQIAFARILFNKPKIAYLDESTSNLDSRTEEHLYNLLKKSGLETFVSVGHKKSLVKHHSHVLEFNDMDGWVLYKKQEYMHQHPKAAPSPVAQSIQMQNKQGHRLSLQRSPSMKIVFSTNNSTHTQ